MVQLVHASALVADQPRPEPGCADQVAVGPPPPGGSVLRLPELTSEKSDALLAQSLRSRRSSFGSFTAHPALKAADLGRILATVGRMAHSPTDVAPSPRTAAWTRLWVLPNAVDGLDSRGYAYDEQRHELIGGAPIDFAELQRHYALTNYNLQEVAAVLVITGRLEALVDTYGSRGYRMLSIEVGQAAQTTYLAATARGIGVGAVLGIDNPAVDEMLGLTGTGEHSMLFVLLGHERRGPAGDLHQVHGHRPAGRDPEGPLR